MAPLLEAADRGLAKDGQDIVAAWLANWRPGFFVEIGSQDGLRKSNCWLLEDAFGWTGVCVEPNVGAHDELRRNRRAAIDHRAVSGATGLDRLFRRRLTPGAEGESQILDFAADEGGPRVVDVAVPTVTLRNLLEDHRTPARIDYLSIDIEGAEREALFELGDLPFRFSFITCEHNHREDAHELRRILETSGYRIVRGDLSRNEFWAVDASGPFADRPPLS